MTEPNRLPVRSNTAPEPTAAFWAIKILDVPARRIGLD